jgi:hypothetical protein
VKPYFHSRFFAPPGVGVNKESVTLIGGVNEVKISEDKCVIPDTRTNRIIYKQIIV